MSSVPARPGPPRTAAPGTADHPVREATEPAAGPVADRAGRHPATSTHPAPGTTTTMTRAATTETTGTMAQPTQPAGTTGTAGAPTEPTEPRETAGAAQRGDTADGADSAAGAGLVPGAVPGAAGADLVPETVPAARADAEGEWPDVPEEEPGELIAPLGVVRTPTDHPGVDAGLHRLGDLDHLPVDGHLSVYEDVHQVLRDVLDALDQRPGPGRLVPAPSPHDHRS